MKQRHLVLVGGGLTSATAAETLRTEGFDGPITILGRENRRPYLRPPLSKGYLAGTEEESSLFVHDLDWYEQNAVELRSGCDVAGIDARERRIRLSDGPTVPYDGLLLATGAQPRRLMVPGEELPQVHHVRTLDDSARLRHALVERDTPHVVLIGAGWIGMEVAATARQLGAQVTVVGRQAIPLAGAIGEELGEVFQRRHERAGVRFRMSEDVRAIVGSAGRVSGVMLASGELLPADLVVVAIGVQPETELARGAGLAVGRSILVDRELRTTDPSIWAAGDAATVQLGHGREVHSEHWANAIATGRLAALSMMGKPAAYDEVPYFYTDQFDLGMEYWGDPGPASELLVRGDLESEAFVAFWVEPTGAGVGHVLAGMHVNVWDAAEEIPALVRSERLIDLASLTEGAEAA